MVRRRYPRSIRKAFRHSVHLVVKCVMAHDIDLVVVFPQCGQVTEMLSGSAIGIAPCPVTMMLSLLVQLALIVNCTSGQVLIS
jgi:hypothetical protein